MKILHGALIGLLFFSLASCKKEAKTFNPDTIPVRDCRSFSAGDKTLQICLDSIVQDSRCPLNAECIWAGVGVARFSASAGNESHVFDLGTYAALGYQNSTVVEGFKVELISLLPAPDLNQAFNYSDYKAQVKVTRL